MKNHFLSITLIALALLSCKKEEGSIAPGSEASVSATAWSDHSWQEGDAIGVFTTDGISNAKATLTAGASSTEGTFTGSFGEAAKIDGAYWPYSDNAGNNADKKSLSRM